MWPLRPGCSIAAVEGGNDEMFVRNAGEPDQILYQYDGRWQASTLPAMIPSLGRIVTPDEASAAAYSPEQPRTLRSAK